MNFLAQSQSENFISKTSTQISIKFDTVRYSSGYNFRLLTTWEIIFMFTICIIMYYIKNAV